MNVLGNIFVGEFLYQLDGKHRLCIPSKWRFSGAENDVYLALPNPIGCITIYPPKMVARLAEKVAMVSLGDEKGQRVLSQLFSQADTFGCDKQGRITLSEKLRTHAALRGDQAMLVGSYVTFNIWEPKRYQTYHTEPFDKKNVAVLLQQLGL